MDKPAPTQKLYRYISVTAYFITNDFKFLSRCLSTKEVAKDHNAESLTKVLQEIFEEWAVTGKVYGATYN